MSDTQRARLRGQNNTPRHCVTLLTDLLTTAFEKKAHLAVTAPAIVAAPIDIAILTHLDEGVFRVITTTQTYTRVGSVTHVTGQFSAGHILLGSVASHVCGGGAAGGATLLVSIHY